MDGDIDSPQYIVTLLGAVIFGAAKSKNKGLK